jgi:MEMO1 family protein
MSEAMIFNSAKHPVPPVRRDLQLIPLDHNGEQVLYFHDSLGYVPANFALRPQVEPILSLINGSFSIEQISRAIQGKIDQDQLLEFVQLLDRNCILESGNYRHIAEQKEEAFETSLVRPSSLAGESYPADKNELCGYLEQVFSSAGKGAASKQPEKALYAPHIDPRVDQKVYAAAFSSLKKLQPARVVILATSHYSGYYPELYDNTPFIGTDKVFEMPHGSIPVDMDYFRELNAHSDSIGFSANDRAHRMEHSIELHLLFARYIWDHEFNIVPVLVTSFEDLLYKPDGHLNDQILAMSALMREMDDDDTFYLISGDLAHVGKKFGDPEAASTLRRNVELFDKRFIDSASTNNPDQLHELVRAEYDRYRICGFPPLYTFLSTFPGLKGELLGYHWWDERIRESAVSFAAIGY